MNAPFLMFAATGGILILSFIITGAL